ncbi:MAG TPA: SDR family NAD(P)-dependent oxidoreductase [bacterium]|nr:SDR family NAD(P)-dependent oxidoreductase [bacterium]
MKKVLVTGGAGFIGQAVCKVLIKNGYEVTAFDIDNKTHKDFFENPNYLPKVNKIRGSILDAPMIDNIVRGHNFVIHLAAALGVQYTDNRPRECLNTNIMGTVNLLEACVKERVKKIILSSSSEIYGEPIKTPIEEDDKKNPMSVYAVTKLAGEEYLKAYFSFYKLDYGIVRFFNVYGPNQVAQFVIPKFINAFLNNEAPVIYGSGEQVRSYCYVDDVAYGVLKILENNSEYKIFNIGNDSEPISVKDLAFKIRAILKKENIEIKSVKIENSDRKAEREIYNRVPSIDRAKKILGYKYSVSLEEGIKKTAECGKLCSNWIREI